eukprot:1649715-Rhodomonas_salina.1
MGNTFIKQPTQRKWKPHAISLTPPTQLEGRATSLSGRSKLLERQHPRREMSQEVLGPAEDLSLDRAGIGADDVREPLAVEYNHPSKIFKLAVPGPGSKLPVESLEQRFQVVTGKFKKLAQSNSSSAQSSTGRAAGP